MKKRGFSLIELLAVIVVLAVVALIATPIVLNVIDETKASSAKSEVSLILKGVTEYCEHVQMKKKLGYSIEDDFDCREESQTEITLTNEQLVKMVNNVDEGNDITVKLLDGKITFLTVQKGIKKAIYDPETGKIDVQDSEVVEEPTYLAYSIGDNVTLRDGTSWIVIKDTNSSESEIKLLSSLRIRNSLTNETGVNMFNDDHTLSLGDTFDWENSQLKAYLDGTVKTRLESSLNTTISDITLIGIEELTTLGCTVEEIVDEYGNITYGRPICDYTKSWSSKVFSGSQTWTKIQVDSNSNEFYVFSSFQYLTAWYNYLYGARPVITVSKSVISQ